MNGVQPYIIFWRLELLRSGCMERDTSLERLVISAAGSGLLQDP
jgi:hypothetical protein